MYKRQDKNTLWDIYFLNAFVKYANNIHEKWTLNSTAYYRNSTVKPNTIASILKATDTTCLLYTSDAADERSSVDLGGRRIIKKKKT